MQLSVSAKLEQKLSPQMIQSLKLLQVNAQELEVMIKQELEVNPLLATEDDLQDMGMDDDYDRDDDREEGPDEGPDEGPEEVPDEPTDEIADTESDDIDWDEYLNDGFDFSSRTTDMSANPEETLERTPIYESSFQQSLLLQLHDRDIDPFLVQVVEYLIECLNEEGFLESSALDPDQINFGDIDPDLEDTLFQIEVFLREGTDVFESPRIIQEALHVLWTMEPIGIGARNLRECLLIQASRRQFDSPLVMPILQDNFPMLQKVQVSLLAKAYETTPDKIQKALAEIGGLDPRPARSMSHTTAGTVIPDLIVETIDGEIRIALNDRNMPQLHVSPFYSSMLSKGSAASQDEKKFIRDKLNSANWLIRSIDQRKSTMMKVMKAIVDKQRDFFERGPAYLKPMILQDIADIIEMHISTVNRVTNGKYVQTEMGVFELKTFFTAAVPQGEGGEDVSSTQAKEAIKALIAEENPKKPLSDQKIADALQAQGLSCARRTVAKYREAMQILPARLRKKFD